MNRILLITVSSFFMLSLRAAELPQFPFVFSQGKAHIEVPPDMATIDFRVHVYHEKSEHALAELRERAHSALGLIKSYDHRI